MLRKRVFLSHVVLKSAYSGHSSTSSANFPSANHSSSLLMSSETLLLLRLGGLGLGLSSRLDIVYVLILARCRNLRDITGSWMVGSVVFGYWTHTSFQQTNSRRFPMHLSYSRWSHEMPEGEENFWYQCQRYHVR